MWSAYIDSLQQTDPTTESEFDSLNSEERKVLDQLPFPDEVSTFDECVPIDAHYQVPHDAILKLDVTKYNPDEAMIRFDEQLTDMHVIPIGEMFMTARFYCLKVVYVKK